MIAAIYASKSSSQEKATDRVLKVGHLTGENC
jgi:hypothetical protein